MAEKEVTVVLQSGDGSRKELGSVYAKPEQPLDALRGVMMTEELQLPSPWVFLTLRGHTVSAPQEKLRVLQQVKTTGTLGAAVGRRHR